MDLVKKKIAAVIVTYNRKEKLKECVEAILSQKYPIYKIFIIDNASTDGTYDYISEILNNHIEIEYIKMRENLGGSGGFHIGFEKAVNSKPDYIWACDDDAINEDDTLYKLMSFALKNKKGCYTANIIVNNKSVFHNKSEYFFNKDCSEIDQVGFGSFIVPINAVEKVGIPRGDLFIYYDDTEYCIRLRSKGYKIYCVTKAFVMHPQNFISQNYKNLFNLKKIHFFNTPNFREYYCYRNAILIYKYPSKFKYIFKGIQFFIRCCLFQRHSCKMALLAIFHGIIGKSGKVYNLK